MANHVRDFSFQKIGMLTAIKRIHSNKSTNAEWVCLCECGNFTSRSSNQLCNAIRDKKRSSCGCVGGNQTHNLLRSSKKLYMVWGAMKARCYRPSCKDFKNYGERGISICDEWVNDFSKFHKWAIESGYEEGISTIERVDVNGDYNPENCTWILNERQALNTRKVIILSANGITKPLSDWAEEIGIRPNTIKTRLRLGWSVEDALFKTVRKY